MTPSDSNVETGGGNVFANLGRPGAAHRGRLTAAS